MIGLGDNAFGSAGKIIYCTNHGKSNYVRGELPVTVLDIDNLEVYKVLINVDTIGSEFPSGAYIFINCIYATDDAIVFDVKSENRTRIFMYGKDGIPLGNFDLGAERVVAVISMPSTIAGETVTHIVTCKHDGDDREFYNSVLANMFFVRRQHIATTKKNLTWVLVSELRSGHIHVITADPDFSELIDYDYVFTDQKVVQRVFTPAGHNKKFINSNAGSAIPCLFNNKPMLIVAEKDSMFTIMKFRGKNRIEKYSIMDSRIVHDRNIAPIGQVNVDRPLVLHDYANGDLYVVAGRKADDTYMMKINNMRVGKVDYEMLYLPFNFYYNTVARWMVCNGIIARYGCLTGNAIALYWKRADDTIGTSGLAYIDDEMYIRNLSNILVSLKKSRVY
jgi:hypothetical protein